MTEAQKKALINKLGAASNGAFDARYSEVNRKWFVAKIIEALLAQGVTDANIEKKANDIIAAAGAALKARITAGFSTASLPKKWALYDQLKSRTQIIYGMIAMYPAFLDPGNAGYFDFILERRFRSIQRMAFYVNPNSTRNVFAYPSSTPPQPMKVNKDADPFWTGANSGTLPFILAASGKTDPVTADENLFKKNAGNNRNLFACDPVATTLHMDALRAAKDPGKLLKALVAVGDHYLKIDNPLGHFANYPDGQRLVGVTSAAVTAGANVEIPLGKVGRILTFSKTPLTPALLTTDAFIPVQGTFFTIVLGDDRESFLIDGGVNPVTRKIKVSKLLKSYGVGAKVYVQKRALPAAVTQPYHFITDTRPTNALFEQLTVAAADLQVGDHVYVVNHPLYGIYYPTGAWGGEHSFISEIGSRDSTTAFRTSLKVEGHGLNDTLLGMGNEMLEWVNTVLSIVQAVTPIHLNNLKANGRKSTAKVNFIQRKESGVDINVFEYNMPYTYMVFDRGKKTPNPMTSGFVLKERAADPSVFQLFNANGKDSNIVPTTPAQDVFLAVGFIGTTFATEQFTASKWGVGYFNTQTATLETQPLFEKDNKTPKLLTFDDLAKAKPFYLTDDNGIAYVTRPRVDFSAAYQAFLKSNGAI